MNQNNKWIAKHEPSLAHSKKSCTMAWGICFCWVNETSPKTENIEWEKKPSTQNNSKKELPELHEIENQKETESTLWKQSHLEIQTIMDKWNKPTNESRNTNCHWLIPTIAELWHEVCFARRLIPPTNRKHQNKNYPNELNHNIKKQKNELGKTNA